MKHMFQMGNDEQIDIMMKKELSSLALQEVVGLEEKLISAIRESNLPVLDQLLDDELIFTNHMGMSLTKQDDLAPHRSGDLKIKCINVSDQLVKLHGDTVVVVVSKNIQGAYLGSEFDIHVRFTRVWKLKNALWKVIAVSSVPLPV